MDFMRIIRSLEELLYEAMTWLVFYPRTMWRTVIYPVGMLAYARAELDKPEESRFEDAISGPLFLIFTLAISHGFELAMHLHPVQGVGGAAGRLLGSDQNLIIVRALTFASFPLMFALDQVRASGQKLTHKSLRGPFFGECYPAAAFGLAFGVGSTCVRAPSIPASLGVAIMVLALLWYVGVQVMWRRRLGRGWGAALTASLLAFLAAAMSVVVLSTLMILAIGGVD